MRAKTDQKSIKKSTQKWSASWHRFLVDFGRFLDLSWGRKSTKNRSKNRFVFLSFFGSVLVPFWVPKRSPKMTPICRGGALGGSRAALGSSWCGPVSDWWLGFVFLTLWRSFLGPSWGHFGSSWGYLGPSWGHLGPSGSHLGAILGLSGAIFGPFWPILGLLGASLRFRGALLGFSGSLGPLVLWSLGPLVLWSP